MVISVSMMSPTGLDVKRIWKKCRTYLELILSKYKEKAPYYSDKDYITQGGALLHWVNTTIVILYSNLIIAIYNLLI